MSAEVDCPESGFSGGGCWALIAIGWGAAQEEVNCPHNRRKDKLTCEAHDSVETKAQDFKNKHWEKVS